MPPGSGLAALRDAALAHTRAGALLLLLQPEHGQEPSHGQGPLGGERLHPLRGAEHTPPSPSRVTRAQQGGVPSLPHREPPAPAARHRGRAAGALRVEHTSEGPGVLGRLQPGRLSTVSVVWHQLLPATVGGQAPCATRSPSPWHGAGQWPF